MAEISIAHNRKITAYPAPKNYALLIGYVSRNNLGASFKNFYFPMNWTGAANRSIVLSDDFRIPFMGENRALMQFQLNNRWTEETAATAKYPTIS